jgi:PEGA domain
VHRPPLACLVVLLCIASTPWSPAAQAQGRHRGGRGPVFVGGYFYDPFYGPYPWWGPEAYPYDYAPVYDDSASVRVLVTQSEASVYVDGFYAGIVDDFDGLFQRLPLPPGEHEVVLYLEGYRTVHQRLNLAPNATYKIHYTMEKLPAGETSEPAPSAPPVPPPPGSAVSPITGRGQRSPLPGSASPVRPERERPEPVRPTMRPEGGRQEGARQEGDFGTIAIRAQPAGAEVTIDGERWMGSGIGAPLLVQMAEGRHRITVQKEGYRPFSTEIDVRRGETTPINVSLSMERDQ